MSAAHPFAGPRSLVRAILVVAFLITIGAVAITSAAPVPASRLLDADAVARAGLALSWTSASVGDSRLAVSRDRLLAVSADGSAVAAGSGAPGSKADLVIARSDGSQIRLTGSDPLGASFSPDGGTVWVVNLAGAVSLLDLTTGAQTAVAPGPYAASVVVAGDGSVLALALDSAEAPTRSTLTRVAPDGTVRSLLLDVRLVYRVFVLDNGAMWALVHRPGDAPRLIAIADELPVTDLPVGLDLDVSSDGRHLVWTDAGEVHIASVDEVALAKWLGPGSSPRFEPSGTAVLVQRGEAARVLGIGGELITDLTAGACWAGDGNCDS